MEWKHADSTNRPLELDTTISKVYNFVRKNIVEKQVETEGETITMYEYDELMVPKADWLLFESMADSESRISDVEDAVIELAEIIGGE